MVHIFVKEYFLISLMEMIPLTSFFCRATQKENEDVQFHLTNFVAEKFLRPEYIIKRILENLRETQRAVYKKSCSPQKRIHIEPSAGVRSKNRSSERKICVKKKKKKKRGEEYMEHDIGATIQ